MKTSVKYYHLMVGAQGQVKLAKVAKKSSTYDVTHKKAQPPIKKFYLSADNKTCRILTLRPGLTRTGAETFPHKATCDPAVFANRLN